MIRLSKLSDYAIVILCEMARACAQVTSSTSALAQRSGLPDATVAKILKCLTRGGIVASSRGISGGYMLARPAADISVADIVSALEGPIALTECVGEHEGHCNVERLCAVRGHWDRINTAVQGALASVSLADMAMPAIPKAFMTERDRVEA